MKIKQPLYIAYGTNDGSISTNLDRLPLEFYNAGKDNLTFKTYVNYDHQFFEIDMKSREKIYRGDAVAAEWMKWLDQN